MAPPAAEQEPSDYWNRLIWGRRLPVDPMWSLDIGASWLTLPSFFYEQCDWKKKGWESLWSWMRRPAIGSQSHLLVAKSLPLCFSLAIWDQVLDLFQVDSWSMNRNETRIITFLRAWNMRSMCRSSIYAISSANIQTSTMPCSTSTIKEEGDTPNPKIAKEKYMQMQTPRKHLRVLLHFAADVEMSSRVALSQKRFQLYPFAECMSDIKRRDSLSRRQTFVG